MMDTDSTIPIPENGTDVAANDLHQETPIIAKVTDSSSGSLEIEGEGLDENLEEVVEFNDDNSLCIAKEITEEPALPPQNHLTRKTRVGASIHFI